MCCFNQLAIGSSVALSTFTWLRNRGHCLSPGHLHHPTDCPHSPRPGLLAPSPAASTPISACEFACLIFHSRGSGNTVLSCPGPFALCNLSKVHRSKARVISWPGRVWPSLCKVCTLGGTQ